jgi:hypothetical protein
MRDRIGSAPAPRPAASRRRIRTELERRGVDRALSQPMAARLAPLLETLPARACAAALDAATAALELTRLDGSATHPRSADVAEIQRLMLGFTDELRKLEEGLRILSAFVLRMRTRAGLGGDGVIH